MLLLTRKPKESITIETSDGIIYITICSISGNRATVGIEAPDDINIWRTELTDQETKGP